MLSSVVAHANPVAANAENSGLVYAAQYLLTGIEHASLLGAHENKSTSSMQLDMLCGIDNINLCQLQTTTYVDIVHTTWLAVGKHIELILSTQTEWRSQYQLVLAANSSAKR